jgi:formylglycine-generating enzyme required for sulfatase activity
MAEWFKDLDVGPEMVVVPAGSFMMGTSASEIAALKEEFGDDWHDAEGPQRRVAIKVPFAVGRFAITYDEWDAAGLSHRPTDLWGRGRRPVIKVSWEDARTYARWLSETTAKTYRLLSEAEWEYCCRAGTTTPFWWGNSISTTQANYNGNTAFGGGSRGQHRSQTVRVDSFEPNPWGLYQVHGNVLEWCEDNWHENYEGAPLDGSVRSGGDASQHVLRGGSWFGFAEQLRSADRLSGLTDERHDFIGFRLARAL